VKIQDYPKTIARKEQYTSGDVAILLGISHRTATKLIDRGAINSFKLPGSSERRILHAELMAFLGGDPSYQYALAKITDPEATEPQAE
jgi:excisionase family DNA binding protein